MKLFYKDDLVDYIYLLKFKYKYTFWSLRRSACLAFYETEAKTWTRKYSILQIKTCYCISWTEWLRWCQFSIKSSYFNRKEMEAVERGKIFVEKKQKDRVTRSNKH